MAPPNPPLPAACIFPFHPVSGSHTSIRISESDVGVNCAVTRQNAGSVLKASPADAFVAVGAVEAPASTTPAEATLPLVSRTRPIASQPIGRGAPTRADAEDSMHARSETTAISRLNVMLLRSWSTLPTRRPHQTNVATENAPILRQPKKMGRSLGPFLIMLLVGTGRFELPIS